jgi:plasmid stabilization system protein ParE
MARIELAAEIADDFERILEYLLRHEAVEPTARIAEIVRAIDVLEFNPRIGRPVSRVLRELIIGRDANGYVALYTYLAQIDTVFVLAIRGQREAGYARN